MIRVSSTSPIDRRNWLATIGLALLFAVLVLVPVGAVRAQSADSIVWDRYDVTLDVQSDGTVQVTEYQEITFYGEYSQGFAYIPLTQIEDIEDVTVSVANQVGDTPQPLEYVRSSLYDADTGTYTYGIMSGELAIDYAFDPTSWSGSTTRVVVLEYVVEGAIRVYEDLEPANQQIWWYAITEDTTDVAPVSDATVTINLPEVVAQDDLVAYPENPEISGNSVTWQRLNLGEGDEFEVSLQFPPITSAQVPDWQARDDQIRQEREEADERSAWAGFLLLIAGLITIVGGGVGLYALWFTRGRDPQVGLVAEYIPEPPDDLRPGAVGTLLDETFHSRDVVATVLDLARRGVIKMSPNQGDAGAGAYSFVLEQHSQTLRDYEKIVLDVIFGAGAKPGVEQTMPNVAGALATRNSQIADGFYQEVLDHGYFKENPQRVRNRWKTIYKTMPFLIGLAVIGIVVAAGAWSNFAFLPIAAGFVLMIVATRLSTAMPRKTMTGAESAAKWSAFRKYLHQIEERNDIAESKEIFERYLPYAVALGLAEEWVAKFAYVRTPAPDWYGGGGTLIGGGRTVIIGDGRDPRRDPNRGGGWTMIPGQGPGGPGGSSGSGGGIPGMQDISDSAAGGLQGGSDSFFDMLSTVAKAFEGAGSGSGSFGSSGSRGSFSGGGSRGGGSRSGGGGGGGRRGFK